LNGLEQAPNNLLPIVLETIMGRREKVEVFGTDYETGDGSCIRDYVHVSDLADAHLRALNYLQRENQDLVLNLGTSKGLSVLEIMQIAREVSGQEFNYTLGPRRAGDPAVVLAKADLAEELLDWKPKHSDANTLLVTTLRAYQQSS
jgi:UDP-glucose 4-epimerase